jgi:hypothetical protein
VTFRKLEESLFSDFDIAFRIVDDYRVRQNVTIRNSKRLLSLIKNLAGNLLNTFGIIAIQSDDGLKLRPWTLIIRGHYSRLRQPVEVLNPIFSYFATYRDQVLNPFPDIQRALIIHFRLGDLLSIPEKSPIPTERLVAAIHDVLLKRDLKIFVNSDSPDVAIHRLTELMGYNSVNPIEIEQFCEPLRGFLCFGTLAPVFIGTNSKLSLWIALFRLHLKRDNTFLPRELIRDIYAVSPNAQSVKFY